MELSVGKILAPPETARRRGDSDGAIASYRAATASKPDHGDAWYALANLKTYRFDDGEIARMREQAERGDLAFIEHHAKPPLVPSEIEERGHALLARLPLAAAAADADADGYSAHADAPPPADDDALGGGVPRVGEEVVCSIEHEGAITWEVAEVREVNPGRRFVVCVGWDENFVESYGEEDVGAEWKRTAQRPPQSRADAFTRALYPPGRDPRPCGWVCGWWWCGRGSFLCRGSRLVFFFSRCC